MKRLGILASHRGTNFQAIVDACHDGRLQADVVVAISNNSRSIALQRARQAGIDTAHLSNITHTNPDHLDQAILEQLLRHGVDLVITAGYMKQLGPKTLLRYAGRLLNIHPSLLPKYGGKGMYGKHVHQAVIDADDTETGITIHWVEGDYDTGPIIAQHTIPVLENDTPESLSERILTIEHELLITTLSGLLEQ